MNPLQRMHEILQQETQQKSDQDNTLSREQAEPLAEAEEDTLSDAPATQSKEVTEQPQQQEDTDLNAPAKFESQTSSDLAPVLLGHNTTTHEPVYLSYASRDQGVLIEGATGTGKSSSIENLVQQDFKNGTAAIVLDPHGELTEHLLEYAAYNAVPNVYVLEVEPAYPFGLNLYKPDKVGDELENSRRIDIIMQVFKKQWKDVSWGPRIEHVIRNTAKSLMYLPDPTMLDVLRLFYDPNFRNFVLGRVTDPQVKFFWQEYEQVRDKIDFRGSTYNKIDEYSNTVAKYIVGQVKTTVDFQALFDENATLLIPLPIGKLGEGVVELIGNLLIAQLTTVIYSQTTSLKTRLHLYIDEYGRFCTPWTTNLLKEGRKFKVGTTVAHQTRADLKDEASREAELQMGSLIAFRGTPADGETLAMKYKLEPQLEVIGEKEARAFHPKPLTYLTALTPTRNPVIAHEYENEEVREILEKIEFGWKRFLPLLDKWILALEEGRLTEGSADELMDLKKLLTTKDTTLIDRHPMDPDYDIGLETNVDHDLSYCWHYNLLPGFSDYTRGDKTAARYELYPKVYEHLYELIDQLAQYRGQPFGDSLTIWNKMLEEVVTYAQNKDVSQKAKTASIHWKDEFNAATRRLLSERGITLEAEDFPREAFDALYHYLKDQQATHNYYTCPEHNPNDYKVLTPSVQEIKRPVFITLTSILSILRLGHLISKFPVTIRTGRTEPITRQRQLADIKLEQANNLATHDDYEAMVRLKVPGENGNAPKFQQAHIRTVKPESPKGDPKALEYIRQRSRERFGRPAAKVEAEIAARWAKLTQPTKQKRRTRQEAHEEQS